MIFKTIAATLCVSLCAPCQPAPEFEVSSVRLTPDGARMGIRGGPGSTTPERVTISGASLTALISLAYSVPYFQIKAPDWLGEQRFDVNATLPARTTTADYRRMLQNLLVSRFHLKIHHEIQQRSSYELAVAPGGHKLKESASREPAADQYAPLPPVATVRAIAPNALVRIRFGGQNISIDDLARRLESILEEPVQNNTGLTGKYDLTLEYSSGAPATAEVPAAAVNMPPPILQAVPLQLGLDLRPLKKAQVDLLVVDSADRLPTEN